MNLSSSKLLEKFFISILFIAFFSIISLCYLLYIFHNASLILGKDFSSFYTGGLMMLHNQADKLYSLPSQFYWQHQVLPQLKNQDWLLPFISPPFVALIFLPFAILPLTTAYSLWEIINVLIILFFCVIAWKMFKQLRWYQLFAVIGMILTFRPVWEVIDEGQLSLVLALSLFLG